MFTEYVPGEKIVEEELMMHRFRLQYVAGRIVVCVVLCLFVVAAHAASSWYVATSGNNSQGTNWSTAYTNIQTALNAANTGDTIYIKGETFSKSIDEPQLVWTTNNLTILGSYQGVGSPGSNSMDEWPTVIQRNWGPPPHSAQWYNTNCRAMLIKGITGGTMERLTMSGWLHMGYPSPSPDYSGGVLFVSNSTDVAISSCIFKDGDVYTPQPPVKGANVYVGNSTNVTFSSCEFKDGWNYDYHNDCGRGAGLYSEDSFITLTNCTVQNNQSSAPYYGGRGAGVYIDGGSAVIVDSMILGNMGDAESFSDPLKTPLGGGLYLAGLTNIVRNCLIQGNMVDVGATNRGDGIYVETGFVSLENCSIIGNRGQGVFVDGGTISVTNCIVWDNGDDLVRFPTNASGILTGVWYSDIEDGDNDGVNGCISADPLFEYGYYLATNSPCVNAGSAPASVIGLSNYTTHADGTLDSGTVDLGYHYTSGILQSPLAQLYVAADGSDSNQGTNWTTAFRSITKALSKVTHGSRIYVGTGTYNNAVETFPLLITKAGLELLGTNADETVVNADGATQRVMNVKGSGNCKIQGLTITKGKTPPSNIRGGGIGLWQSDVEIVSCNITSNEASWGSTIGGGIYLKGSAVVISNCLIEYNWASADWSTSGGGIYAGVNCELTVLDSVIRKNFANANGSGSGQTAGGAGVHIDATYAASKPDAIYALRNSVISENYFTGGSGIFRGGGLRVEGARTVTVENCVFSSNALANADDTVYAGGIFGWENAVINIRNCTIATNFAEGIQITNNCLALVRNTILWNNGDELVGFPTNAAGTLSNVWYSCIEDGDNDGVNGCVSVDPAFVDMTYFHLKSKTGNYVDGYFGGGSWANSTVHSPLIDAGDPESDYSREPKFNGRRINIGAYGNTAVASKSLARGTVMMFR